MKVVFITQRLMKIDEYDEVRNALDVRWQHVLSSVNLLPVPLPLGVNISLYQDLNIGGIILTGGGDLYSQSQNKLSYSRDKYEKECIEYAIDHSIPIMGICRGMQLIAEFFGSTLKRIDNHVAVSHGFYSLENNRYHELFSEIDEVNSYHNFSIDKLGPDLEIIGKSVGDNSIEAISHNKYSIIAQMWHPEREDNIPNSQLNVFSSFFNA